MELVTLESRVASAIAKAGAKFNAVIVDTGLISSAGIPHIKHRHLDDFLEFSLYKAGKEVTDDELVEEYSKLKGIDDSQLQEYFQLFKDLNEVRDKIEAMQNCKSRIDRLLGTVNAGKRKFLLAELRKIGDNLEGFGKYCDILNNVYELILEKEKKRPELFKMINEDILGSVKEIIKNPFLVYFHRQKRDFTFCSNIYGICYVLTLKIGESGEAYLFTGYKSDFNVVKKDANLKRIYGRDK